MNLVNFKSAPEVDIEIQQLGVEEGGEGKGKGERRESRGDRAKFFPIAAKLANNNCSSMSIAASFQGGPWKTNGIVIFFFFYFFTRSERGLFIYLFIVGRGDNGERTASSITTFPFFSRRFLFYFFHLLVKEFVLVSFCKRLCQPGFFIN